MGRRTVDCEPRVLREVVDSKEGLSLQSSPPPNKGRNVFINKGKVLMECDGKTMIMTPGEALLIEPYKKHRFTGLEDSEIFEFSTHHEDSDSYRDELSGKVDLSNLLVPAPNFVRTV